MGDAVLSVIWKNRVSDDVEVFPEPKHVPVIVIVWVCSATTGLTEVSVGTVVRVQPDPSGEGRAPVGRGEVTSNAPPETMDKVDAAIANFRTRDTIRNLLQPDGSRPAHLNRRRSTS